MIWALIAAASVVYSLICLFLLFDFLRFAQWGGYRIREYNRLMTGGACGKIALLSLVMTIACFFANLNGHHYAATAAVVIVASAIYLVVNARINHTKPLKATARLIRLCVAQTVLVAAAVFGLLSLAVFLGVWIELFGFVPLIAVLMLNVSMAVVYPIEWCVQLYYIKRTKKQLNAHKDLIRIGITGSFAKTTVKGILRDMLKSKYRVCASPKSYNTPMGICRTVHETMEDGDEVFIAEMGARYRHDIEKLCDIVRPTVGILTGIGNQHLETFGSISRLMDTKYELIESLPQNGFAAFGSAGIGCKMLYQRCAVEKVMVSADMESGAYHACAQNIAVTTQGTEFDLVLGAQKETFRVSTVLLGRHNVSNILLCCTVCLKLGMTAAEIAASIKLIRQTEHRLQLMPSTNPQVTVIDDSFNASADGMRAAMEVLASFHRPRIVITPGVIELGDSAARINRACGEQIAYAADYCIVLGENASFLTQGLLDGGMKQEHIIHAESRDDAVKQFMKIQGNKVVMFCSDLPT